MWLKKAIFIAVQLSSITHALRAVNCENVSDLNGGRKEVEYCEFVNDKDDCKISLSMLLTYLFANEKDADEKSYAVLKEMQNNEGAIASCILMSIVQTAKENSLDVEKYLNYVLTKINTAKISDLKDLLPYSDKIPNEFIVNVT